VIKLVSNLRQVSCFLHQQTESHDITEILSKVALNTINHKPSKEAKLILLAHKYIIPHFPGLTQTLKKKMAGKKETTDFGSIPVS